jgi:hypothetical protein
MRMVRCGGKCVREGKGFKISDEDGMHDTVVNELY